jgi:hypothetical protein
VYLSRRILRKSLSKDVTDAMAGEFPGNNCEV